MVSVLRSTRHENWNHVTIGQKTCGDYNGIQFAGNSCDGLKDDVWIVRWIVGKGCVKNIIFYFSQQNLNNPPRIYTHSYCNTRIIACTLSIIVSHAHIHNNHTNSQLKYSTTCMDTCIHINTSSKHLKSNHPLLHVFIRVQIIYASWELIIPSIATLPQLITTLFATLLK